MKNLTTTTKILLQSFLIIFVFGFAVRVIAVWTPATSTPPAGNVAPPINVGSVDQSKAGGLLVQNGFGSTGLAFFGGNIEAGNSASLDDIKFKIESSTGDITKIRNVAYSWPTSIPSSGSPFVLSSNGTGEMSWITTSSLSGMTNPLTTRGDMVYASATGASGNPATPVRLASATTAGKVLISNTCSGTPVTCLPSWGDVVLTPGGFGIQSPNTFLAGPATGTANNNPSFRTIVINDLPTITVAKGGTGLTSISANSVMVSSGTANEFNPIQVNTVGNSIRRASDGGWEAFAPLVAGSISSSGLTVSAGPKLLGRFSSPAGAVQEISIGTGLNLDANGNLTTTALGLPSPSTDDTILVANGTSWEVKSIPNCPDTDGKHLNYNAVSNVFVCGNSTTTSQTMTGTISPATSSCTISAGQSSCTSGVLTWTTTNPVYTSAVTNNGSATPSNPNGNNSSSTFNVPYNINDSGVTTFYLYNNGSLLAQATVQTLCAAGSTWNGSICSASTASFPTLRPFSYGYRTTSGSERHITHQVTLSGGMQIGDLLIVVASFDLEPSGLSTITWPSGWTQLFRQNQNGPVNMNVLEVRYRIVDSLALNFSSFNVQTAVSAKSSFQSFAYYNYSETPLSSVVAGNSSSPDSPSLDVSWLWGSSSNVLWLSVLGLDKGGLDGDNTIISQYPNNFGLFGIFDRRATSESVLSNTGTASVVSAREFTGGSINPSAHTLSSSDYWIAATIAIRGQ